MAERPALERQHEFDEAAVRLSIARIRNVIERQVLKQRDIVNGAQIDKSRLSRWLSGDASWSSIKADAYRRIMTYLETERILSPELSTLPSDILLEEIAFHGMSRFLDVKGADMEKARRKLVGHYATHRYSYYAAPNILRGHLEVYFNEKTQALQTLDHYFIPADSMGAGTHEIRFVRRGYIWPIKDDLWMMAAEKVERKEIQIIYLNKPLSTTPGGPGETIISIEGVIMDWQGPDFYMTKIFLQKLKNAPAENFAGLVPEKELPDVVASKLHEAFTGPHKYLRAYR